MTFTSLKDFSYNSEEEAQDFINDLLTSVVNLINQVAYIAEPLRYPLVLVRQALIYLLDIPFKFKETGTGILTYSILKRAKPTRIYGPYKEFNLPYSIWRLMKEARGMNGSGAGTPLWRWRKSQKGIK